ncbi:MAG: SurA N-terminal domain-containing protein [Candidatus Paceibacterota bacterium]
MSKQKIILLLIVVIAIIAGLWYFLGTANNILPNNSSNNVVAIVNGEEINASELNIQLDQIREGLMAQDPNFNDSNLEAQVLDQIVANTLLRQEAEKANLTVSDAEIETEYNNLATTLGGQEALNKELATINLSDAELKENIASQILVNKYIASQISNTPITVTEAEILALYEEAGSVQELPPLEEIEAEIEAEITRQKRDVLVGELISNISNSADIQILI